MKINLKLLISFLVIVFIFAPQAIYSMENYSKPEEQGIKKRHARKGLGYSDLIEEPQQKKKRAQERSENLFEGFPEETKYLILAEAVIDNNVLQSSRLGSLKCVCKEWNSIINKDFMHKAIKSSYELLGYGEAYRRFYNGKLIYRPNEGSDVGKIEIRISDLSNPLEGKFDLSRCGDAGKYLSISMGYREVKRAENASKVEIWFVPRCLIEKEIGINMTAKRFIFGKWKESAEFGIFWTWGGNGALLSLAYIGAEDMDNLSKINLNEKFSWDRVEGRSERGEPRGAKLAEFVWAGRYFTIHF